MELFELFLLFLLCLVACGTRAASSSNCTVEGCRLPDCYCDRENIPGDLPRQSTPQMVLFTYTGAVSSSVHEALTELFPESLKNPNGCPVTTTVFLVSEDSDDCAVHLLYYQGHEIGLAGLNKTAANTDQWLETIAEQRRHVSEKSFVRLSDIVGVRAPRLKPAGDEQFVALMEQGLVYDSSLMTGPQDVQDKDHPYVWPFTLDQAFTADDETECYNPRCPADPYQGVWEVPVASVLGSRLGKPRVCTYIDDCLSDLTTADDVLSVLKTSFLHAYRTNKAPFQVNLRDRTLEVQIITEGLQKFIRYVWQKQDVWLLSNQEALRWVQNPIPISNLETSEVWRCPRPAKYPLCQQGNAQNTLVTTSLSQLMDVNQLFAWQTALFIVLYFVVYRYDRYVNKR